MNQEAVIGRGSLFNRIIQPLLVPTGANAVEFEEDKDALNQAIESKEAMVGLNLTFRHYEEKKKESNEDEENGYYYTEKQRKGLFHYWDNAVESVY